jgi:hypothetical protein
MSVKVQSLIWENAPYRGNALLALLALGDWSDDDGYCWPKRQTLAKKSRQSLRSARYAVEQLEKDGFLSIDVHPGRGHQNDFQINLQNLHLLASEKMQSETAKRANNNSKRCKPRHRNKEESSSEPSLIGQAQNQHGCAALKFWLSFKEILREHLSAHEWNLWVRPAYYVKTLGSEGKCLLLGVPQGKEVLEAVARRKLWLNDLLRPHGYECGFTKYPDNYDLSVLGNDPSLSPPLKKRVQGLAS